VFLHESLILDLPFQGLPGEEGREEEEEEEEDQLDHAGS
jgi:hypothetical protein